MHWADVQNFVMGKEKQNSVKSQQSSFQPLWTVEMGLKTRRSRAALKFSFSAIEGEWRGVGKETKTHVKIMGVEDIS